MNESKEQAARLARVARNQAEERRALKAFQKRQLKEAREARLSLRRLARKMDWKGWGWKCRLCATTTPYGPMSLKKRPPKPPYSSPFCDGCQKNHPHGKFYRITMMYVVDFLDNPLRRP